MKILITGSGGFVGAAAAVAALARGHEVVALVRPGSENHRLQGVDADIVPVDLRAREAVLEALQNVRPDCVIHSAWSGVSNAARHERRQIDDNIQAAINLVEAAAASGVGKFIGMGSQGEYGLLDGRIAETALPEPTSLYGAAKLAVMSLTRQLCAQSDISFAWLRLFSTYGPGDNPHWLVPSLISQMLDGVRPKTTEGRQRWDYLYIDDVAAGMIDVAETTQATGVFNLGSGQPIVIRRIVELIRDEAAPDLDLVFGEIAYRPDQVWHMEADIERLKHLAGFRPRVSIEEGLARTVQWHRERRRRQAAS